MHNAMHFLQIASLLYRHSSVDRKQMSTAADSSLLRCLRGVCLGILTSCMAAVYVYDLVLRPLGHAVVALLGILGGVVPGTCAAWLAHHCSHGGCCCTVFVAQL